MPKDSVPYSKFTNTAIQTSRPLNAQPDVTAKIFAIRVDSVEGDIMQAQPISKKDVFTVNA